LKKSKKFVQDDSRENRLVDLFNLDRPDNRSREGTDAVLRVQGLELEFELKSVTRKGGSVGTTRDLGPSHFAKWKNKHWIIACYDGEDLEYCKYGSPDAMRPWISSIQRYIRADFEMARVVPSLVTRELMFQAIGNKNIYTLDDAQRIQKKQHTVDEYRSMMDLPDGYSPDRMLEIYQRRLRYLIERGSTLNNPKIKPEFFEPWPTITKNHASTLLKHVRRWLASKRR
jgi:hypothetical protein